MAFYGRAGSDRTPLPKPIPVSGAQRAIEECFQTAKNEAGLAHHLVRDRRAWHTHVILAMLAAAYPGATRAQEADKRRFSIGKDARRGPDQLRNITHYVGSTIALRHQLSFLETAGVPEQRGDSQVRGGVGMRTRVVAIPAITVPVE